MSTNIKFDNFDVTYNNGNLACIFRLLIVLLFKDLLFIVLLFKDFLFLNK